MHDPEPDRSSSTVVPSTWHDAIETVVGHLAAMKALVVIRGEPGAGKESVARLIHAFSPRRAGPFVKVDCAARADRLALELFGHERDAWLGASRRRLGKVEFAHRGTLFLDELGDLPPSLHPGLLQLLQRGESVRLGGGEAIEVDVQVIAATTQRLAGPLTGQRLWETSHALKVLDVQVPPLREQREQIPVLANAFLAGFNARYQRSAELPDEFLRVLGDYPWPGNIRELRGVVRRVVIGDDSSGLRTELEAVRSASSASMKQSA